MTTWLPEAPDGSQAGLLSLRPDLAVAYEAFESMLWTDRLVDPVVLEVCRIRIAQLLGDAKEAARRTPAAVAAGLDPEVLAALPRWSTHPSFGEHQRAALAVAEQFVIDPHAVTDEMVDDLGRHLQPAEVVAFMTALGLFDGFTRFRTTLMDTSQGAT